MIVKAGVGAFAEPAQDGHEKVGQRVVATNPGEGNMEIIVVRTAVCDNIIKVMRNDIPKMGNVVAGAALAGIISLA